MPGESPRGAVSGTDAVDEAKRKTKTQATLTKQETQVLVTKTSSRCQLLKKPRDERKTGGNNQNQNNDLVWYWLQSSTVRPSRVLFLCWQLEIACSNSFRQRYNVFPPWFRGQERLRNASLRRPQMFLTPTLAAIPPASRSRHGQTLRQEAASRKTSGTNSC